MRCGGSPRCSTWRSPSVGDCEPEGLVFYFKASPLALQDEEFLTNEFSQCNNGKGIQEAIDRNFLL